MRLHLLALPLLAAAAPVMAQSAPPAADEMRLPPEMSDPRLADRLTDVMQVLSKAMLDLPVGDVQAAVEGREPTAADKRRTVRSETGMSERQLRQQIDQARPQMQAAMKAMSTALPAMMKGLTEAGRALEEATANMPQPGYPRR
jgi:hypothetical protein